jgi:hypothetical protein
MKKRDFDIEFSKDEIGDDFLKKEEKVISLIRTKLSDNKDGMRELESRNNEILNLIDNLDKRIHYWETRRTQFLHIALGIIGASLAGIIAIIPQIQELMTNSSIYRNWNIFYIPISSSLFTLLLFSIWSVVIWNKQNNPSYPFTKGIKIWRWQYRYAEDQEMTVSPGLQDKDPKFLEEIRKFQSNLILYKQKTIESDLPILYNQNLSQLYLLITNEKFKIEFVTALRNQLILSLKATLFIFICLLLFLIVA